MDIQEKLKKIINLKEDLEKDLASLAKGKKETEKGVFLGKGVTIEPNVFFDTSAGTIIIGDGTKIKAGAVLRGPLLIGKHCRIGGEIEHTIMQDYSNKQHYGYVGHSYLGSWVNLGGGTNTGTLKNTYGEVKVGGVNTGQIQVGAIIGDYVKTSINTSIFPGKIIGPGANLYGMVTEDVPAFTSYVSPGNMYEIPKDIAEKTQTRMAKRREIDWNQSFEELFEMTQGDRDKVGVKKGKLKF
jgi:glucose-1-phosphate thymidylyltransferase